MESKVILLSIFVDVKFEFHVKSKTFPLGKLMITFPQEVTGIETSYPAATVLILILHKVAVDKLVSISHQVKEEGFIGSSKETKNFTGDVPVGSL